MEVTALRNDLLRVRISHKAPLPEDASWAVLPASRTASVRVTSEATGFRTSALRVSVDPVTEELTVRDLAGNNTAYVTNSVTLAGGESADVILDATGLAVGQKFYLYTPNLDHLSNDAENFGGLMTEINICNAVDPSTKQCS